MAKKFKVALPEPPTVSERYVQPKQCSNDGRSPAIETVKNRSSSFWGREARRADAPNLHSKTGRPGALLPSAGVMRAWILKKMSVGTVATCPIGLPAASPAHSTVTDFAKLRG